MNLTSLISRDDTVNWLHTFYKQQMSDCGEGSAKFKNCTKLNDVSVCSPHIAIMEKCIITNILFPTGDEYMCAVFSVTYGITTNYAFIYWRDELDNPEYVCIGPTYTSMDGEYRSLFISYDKFVELIDCSKIEQYEEFVINMLELESELELNVHIYPFSEPIQDYIEKTRLPIMTFALALTMINLPPHTNKNYMQIMNTINARSAVKDFTTLKSLTADQVIEGLGQKLQIMPAGNISDIHSPIWREIQIMQDASNLVINFITPSFPIYNRSIRLDSDADMYDNEINKNRFAKNIISTNAVLTISQNDNILEYHIPYTLSSDLLGGLKKLNSLNMISDFSVLHLMEHVGLTLGSLQPVEIKRIFESKIGAKHIFELLYAMHCLHFKIGVIHGDFHKNNGTIASRIPHGSKFNDIISDDQINDVEMFITGPRGEADSYIFPSTSETACLIDFSRVIIGPNYRIQDNRFYRDQISRIIRILFRFCPDFVRENALILQEIILRDYENIFHILTSIDYILVGETLEKVLILPEVKYSCDLAIKLRKLSEQYLVKNLTRIVSNSKDSNSKDSNEKHKDSDKKRKDLWEILVEELFDEWSILKAKTKKIPNVITIYNFNNDIKYDTRLYSSFPPWLIIEELSKNIKLG